MPTYKVDFKQIAEDVDIFDAARLLRLTIVKNRADCPVCDSERALQFFAETNSFQCHASGDTRNSDCIALYAHIKGIGMYPAAKALKEHFGTPSGARAASSTAPQKPEGRTERSQPAPTFDPDAFAKRLQYTDEVAKLGIGEEDAQRLGIGFCTTGFHRGRVCFPVRDETGAIAGFIGVLGDDVKVPKTWLGSNIVPLKRRA